MAGILQALPDLPSLCGMPSMVGLQDPPSLGILHPHATKHSGDQLTRCHSEYLLIACSVRMLPSRPRNE